MLPVCIYIYMCVCVYIYIYICNYLYLYVHIFISENIYGQLYVTNSNLS